MARRDIFRNIKESSEGEVERPAPSGYTVRGATRNMIASIGELAEKAAKADHVPNGIAVVELDPADIDGSFVSDRLGDDDAFGDLLESIRSQGQDSPILVRPHPTNAVRYQIVFGHRRAEVAKQLGRKVKAVVRDVSDEDHVIAQGQENSARENLSFIERALFAQRLLDRGHDRKIVQVALAVDAPMLTRMLSVSGRVSETWATAIGPCKSIGRDRWIEFAQLAENPEAKSYAAAVLQGEGFADLPSDDRFERVFAELKSHSKRRRGSPSKPVKEKWQPSDMAVAAEFTDTGRSFALSFKSKGAADFGRFVTESLDQLYDVYKQNNEARKG